VPVIRRWQHEAWRAFDEIPAVAIDSLAIYRLTRLAITDTFPPVRRARFAILQRFPEGSWQVELGTCAWCLSVWIAAAVALVRGSRIWRALAFVLAASAVSGALSEKFG
jgi:hypothetical protein